MSRHGPIQRRALEVLHGDEGGAVYLADVVDRADPWVVQGRSCLCLAVKAAERGGIVRDAVRKQLERDEPVEPAVFRLVDDTHPATAEHLMEPVVRDGAVAHRCTGL